MRLLNESFVIFSYCGGWMPDIGKRSICMSLLYRVYRYVTLVTASSLMLIKLFNISQGFEGIVECASRTFCFVDFILAFVKSIAVYNKRDDFVEIERQFIKCREKNSSEEEQKILGEFDKFCRYE